MWLRKQNLVAFNKKITKLIVKTDKAPMSYMNTIISIDSSKLL